MDDLIWEKLDSILLDATGLVCSGFEQGVNFIDVAGNISQNTLNIFAVSLAGRCLFDGSQNVVFVDQFFVNVSDSFHGWFLIAYGLFERLSLLGPPVTANFHQAVRSVVPDS